MNYTDENRGKVQIDERFSQPVHYEGLRFENITPTDIDASVDYHGKFFIFTEIKRYGAQMSRGQESHYESLVDAIDAGKRDAMAIECYHFVFDSAKPILLKDAYIKRVYWKGRWHDCHGTNYKKAWEQSMKWAKTKEDQHDTL